MRRPTLATPALLLAASLALAGCSGGGDDGADDDIQNDQQATMVPADQDVDESPDTAGTGALHAKADAAREYIQDNLGGECPALSPVEDHGAYGAETTTCSTDYGSIIIMSSISSDDTRRYLLATMPSSVDAWDDQDVFFVAAPELLDMINGN